MKKLLTALAVSTALMTSAFAAESEKVTEGTQAATATKHGHSHTFKLMEPDTWGSLVEAPKELGTTFSFNPMSAKFWTGFVNPDTHDKYHAAFTNPAQYAQMLNPAFYVQMMDTNAWMEWVNLDTYKVLVEPKTLKFVFNPESYIHNMNYNYYTQMFDLKNYEAYTKSETYGLGKTEGGFNMFNPASWMQQAQVALSPAPKQ